MNAGTFYRLAGLGLCCTAVAALAGCACERVAKAQVSVRCEEPIVAERPAPLSDARPGECFAQVYVPPKTECVTERVCVRPASERIEIVPACYEWVEEQVCVKPASTRLEVVPAEFRTEDTTVEIQPGYRTWVTTTGENCTVENGKATLNNRVFCLVDQPPVTKTMKVERLQNQPCVREITEPAEFQTVRVQKCVSPATTRRVPVPAEYDEITKTVVVAPGRIEWQRAVCDLNADYDTISKIEQALAARGYDPGPVNGQTDEAFWSAVRRYQTDNTLGVGALTHETIETLGIVASAQ